MSDNSFISNEVNSYMALANTLVIESKEPLSTIKCPLSHLEPSDSSYYLDWVYVQLLNGIKVPYSVDSLFEYIKDKCQVDDPLRSLKYLNHMVRRVRHIASLPSEIRQDIRVNDEKFLLNVLADIYQGWKMRNYNLENLSIIDETYNEYNYGIMLNISLWEKLKLLHVNVGADDVNRYLTEDKSFLLRKSSISEVVSENSPLTVFTLSHMYRKKIYNIRFYQLHGVGIYALTRGCFGIIESYDVPDDVLASDFKRVIEYINYSPPNYVSVLDMLLKLSDEGYIDLSKIV
jgi:hypothetical protein